MSHSKLVVTSYRRSNDQGKESVYLKLECGHDCLEFHPRTTAPKHYECQHCKQRSHDEVTARNVT